MTAPTTTTDAKMLRELADRGAYLVEAADAMAWDFQRVQYWEKRLGLHFKRGRRSTLSNDEIAKLRQFASDGLSMESAAIRMGWPSYTKVQYWEKRLGLKFVRLKSQEWRLNRVVTTCNQSGDTPVSTGS